MFKKEKFFTISIEYLGHVVRPGNLQIVLHSKCAIHGIHLETDMSKDEIDIRLMKRIEMLRFNFRAYTGTLKSKLVQRPSANFWYTRRWSAERMNFLKKLKNALFSPRVLALSNSTCHTALDTDTCDVQVGSVVL